ncbi:MAG TPA: amidase family protein [Solirubrobacteraceae bacterium]|jgi:amidase|nr:amidase family protein [Solirubrobacteraceae bacterium]
MNSDELQCYVPTTLTVAATGAGSLSSLDIAVKDLFAVAGHTSSFGHPRWRDTHEPASANADVVDRLLNAGAAVAGLAKMDQLAYSLTGNVGEGSAPVNAFDPESFCGGSSSGPASAVAGGVADVGLGTDTAGSIRVPAAACGLYSLRAGHDRIGSDGVLPLARSLDAVGVLARSPDVLEAVFRVVAQSPSDGTRVITRVLRPKDPSDYTDAHAAAALTSVATKAAASLGCDVEELDVSGLVSPDVGNLFARIQSREIWAEHAEWVTQNIEHLAPDVQTRLRRCQALSEDDPATIEADLAEREAYAARLRDLIGEESVLALPVLPERGPKLAWSDDDLLAYRGRCFRLTAPSSLGRGPQVVVPMRFEGAACAGSFLGPIGSDESLLAMVRELAGNGEAIDL